MLAELFCLGSIFEYIHNSFNALNEDCVYYMCIYVNLTVFSHFYKKYFLMNNVIEEKIMLEL